MEKVLVSYFTTSGNTEELAKLIAEGIKEDAEVTLVELSDDVDLTQYDRYMLGTPAQGSEEVDITVFDPFVEKNLDKLKDKKVALFGSYGWGGGAYLEDYSEKLKNDGVLVFDRQLTVAETPTASDADDATAFGKDFLKF